MKEDSAIAKAKLLEATRTKDTSQRLAAGITAAAAGLLVILVVALLDYRFLLPSTIRIVGLLALFGTAAWGIRRLWALSRRPTRMKEAALDAEAQKPGLGCEISTAAEYLSGDRKPTEAYEPQLAAALEAKAASTLASLQVPYEKKLLGPAFGLGLAMTAALFFLLFASGALTAFKRAVTPWSKTSYTTIRVMPGEIEIPRGSDIEIKGLFTGRTPNTPRFEWMDEGATTWRTAELHPNERGEHVHPLKNVQTPIRYRLRGGDTTSDTYLVQPYTPPDVKEWRVELTFPDYTRRSNIVLSTPELTALRATMASIQINPTTELSKARLRFSNALPPIELNPTPGAAWAADVKITKDCEFWIELTDARGRKGGNASPYLIRALPDEAPKVEILEPGQDMRSEATNNIPIRISVSDDYGVDEIKLVYHRLGNAEQFISSARRNETNAEIVVSLPLSEMGLQEYELVAYHALARDNNTLDGPGVGKSPVYFIEITNEEGVLCKPPPIPGQKVNLLVIQKQIIADTAVLVTSAPNEKFQELAARQNDARDLAKIYLEGMSAIQAPGEVIAEMEAAMRDMGEARAFLESRSRDQALVPAEKALARLYHLLKILPELKEVPAEESIAGQPKAEPPQSPLLKVVLEAIKKNAKEQPDNEEIEQALRDAKRLEQQASLTLGSQNAGQGTGGGEVRLDRSGKNPSPGKPQEEAENGNSGKGKQGRRPESGINKEALSAQGTPAGGSGQPGQKTAPNKSKNGVSSVKDEPGEQQSDGLKDAQALAEKQKSLSKEAAALAEKLARIAGKDSRLGHGAAKKMSEASASLDAAAEATRSGDAQSAGTKGMQGGAALKVTIALLERILEGRLERGGVANEDYPKEYEAVISDYFKRLSYAE